jgi:hypothetical protein
VLSGLPVVDLTHAVNSLTLGPDGALYLAVGNVDRLWSMPQRLADATTPHPDWLGTILRLDPPGGSPRIFARGLRNVYQVTFDGQGRMWGIDNDGPTLGGWLGEEVLRLKAKANYGYPYDGTFGKPTVRDDFAVWISDGVGSAGLAWAGDVGLGDGLISGSCGELSLIRPLHPTDPTTSRYSETTLLSGVGGCVSSVRVVSADTIVFTVYGSSTSGALWVVRLNPEPPSSTPAP